MPHRYFNWVKSWFPTLDVEYISYQLVAAAISPSELYKLTLRRKQARNQWARSDAAVTFTLCAFVAAASTSWAIAYSILSPIALLFLCIRSVVIFLSSSALVASVCWLVANSKHMRTIPHLPQHSVEQKVEWLFAWDVACNAFVPLFLILYVIQLVFLPMLLPSAVADGMDSNTLGNRVSAVISNVLYAIASVSYWHSIFCGYTALPFLQQTTYFLFPAGASVLICILSSVFGINLTSYWVMSF